MFVRGLVFILCVVFSHQSPSEDQNLTAPISTSTNTSNSSRLRAARQYTAPHGNEIFVEPIFKPHAAYPYPSSGTSQKLQFAHDNNLHIYLYQNKLSLYCATDTTYERITWRKYTCPNQIGIQNGETIAVGPMVSNPHLYGVNSFGRNEEYVSELLIKQPLIPATDGAYVCEGVFMSDKYPYEATSTVRDIIIVGGKGMYQNCFSSAAKFTSTYPTKG